MIFSNREEVIQFQKNLEKYIVSRNQTPICHYELVVAYDICKIRWNPKIFSALVDLRINSSLVICDLADVNRIWHQLDIKNLGERSSERDGSEFVVRMEIHHLLSGVTVRYRALWDKLFDFLLMFKLKGTRTEKENNEIIQKAGITEGKRKLKQVLRTTSMRPENIICIFQHLTRFDSLYRTPEAHSAGGSMSKWTLSDKKMDDTPFPEFLLDAWNLWNQAERMIGQIFGEKALSLLKADLRNQGVIPTWE